MSDYFVSSILVLLIIGAVSVVLKKEKEGIYKGYSNCSKKCSLNKN